MMDRLKYCLALATLCYAVNANTIQPSEAGKFKVPRNKVQGTVFVVNENLLQIKDYKITEEGNFLKTICDKEVF